MCFDAQYGTDTAGIIQPWNLDIPDELVGQAVQYGSAGIDSFTALLESLDIAHREYVFVDLGSGKGRALMLASRFPFQAIIGVELSRHLHQVACRNIELFRAGWQQCRTISSRCENATLFDCPAGNIVLYLFNPFGAETLRSVISKLEGLSSESPRTIYLIYVKPVHRKLFDESESFSPFRSIGSDLIYRANLPGIAGSQV